MISTKILLKRQNPMMCSTSASVLTLQTAFFNITAPIKHTLTVRVESAEDIYNKFLEQQHIPCTGEAFQLFLEDSIKAA